MTAPAILFEPRAPIPRVRGERLAARVLVLMLGPLLAVATQGGGRAWWSRRARPSAAAGPDDFDGVILVHIDAAYNLARYLTGDVELAEDIVQEALLKAYRGFAGYRGDNAKAWLLTIVRRGFIDWTNARRAGRSVFSEETAENAGDHVADPAETAEAALMRASDVSTVQRALQALPEPFRESLILREIEGLSYREVAEMTGVPQGTVMSRLARGRELLARMLKAEVSR